MSSQARRELRGLLEASNEPSLYLGSPAMCARHSDDFRRVLYTGSELQLVVMCLLPGEDIGLETHERVEQAITVVSGKATALVAGQTYALRSGSTMVIPPGTLHNVTNVGRSRLRLSTVYSPPNHPPGTVHLDKAAVESDEADVAFSEKANASGKTPT